MKALQIICVFLLVFISNCHFAQELTLQEAIKLSKMNIDDGDTFISNKGYIFWEAKTFDDFDERTYSHDKSASDKTGYWLIFQYPKKGNYKAVLYWSTPKIQHYNNIKKQLKIIGFVLKSSRVNQDYGSTSLSYTKGNDELILEIKDVGNSIIGWNVVQYTAIYSSSK
jgi:hypothetical protein